MRDTRFTFLCNQDERQLIERLSTRLERSQSDAIRWLIREAARKLESPEGARSRSHESVQAVAR